VAIIRDDHVVMARGDTVLQPGDEVMALVTPESEDQVREMLTGH
jgi:Trk K+ transport system NAD-binding subunit